MYDGVLKINFNVSEKMSALPLSEDKKLTVIFRVEPGCLGPEGSSHISQFCDFSQAEIRSSNSDYIIWNIVPRNDKSLPEMQYSLAGKRLSHAQAEKYLSMFGQDLDKLDSDFGDTLEALINQYMKSI